MKTKLKDEPIFILTALCIFFPVGIILLFFSEYTRKRKICFGLIGGTIFLSLLLLPLLGSSDMYDPSEFQIIVTRNSLSVGQSGGFAVVHDNQYITSFSASASNDNLSLCGSVYTAVHPGKCTIIIKFGHEERLYEIEIHDGKRTDDIVLSSPSGRRYHLLSAQHSGENAIKMTEEEALLSGKTPCKICYKAS